MSGPARHELVAWLSAWVREQLSRDGEAVVVDVDRPLTELGLSSRHAVSLAADLGAHLGRAVDPTMAWRVPTIRAIAEELTSERRAPRATSGHPSAQGVASHEPLAVVGVGCRLPGGVHGPEQLWDLLVGGREAVGTVPDGRWDAFVADSPTERALLASVPRHGGFLDDVAAFDARHFGIAPDEARFMDPQQRLLLEVVWEALEHAGTAPDGLRGSSTGVFVGASLSEYAHLAGRSLGGLDVLTPTGSATSILANRVSYLLGLHGPSLTVDTACSSSLVAFHQACRSLAAGDCDTAVVAGVNLLLSPAVTRSFDLAGLLAADGRCKPFGADADGIVRSEGCGVAVVKRLEDAERDGDRVLAVVRGSAVNSDGRSNGLMAPNPVAQEAVLRTAYAHAGVDPATVDAVEAHGTGTLLGDPIEAGALAAVLGAGREPSDALLLGSAKSNLGHLEAAAGVVGLLKTVLALHHDHLPASLHATETNPHIDFAGGGLRVVDRATGWPRHDGVARAGVSAFGFGGTNAHVVLEEAPRRRTRPEDPAAVHVLVASAPDAESVDERLADVRALLSDAVDVDDLATATARRLGHGPVRSALVGRGRTGLLDAGERVDARLDHPGARPVWVFSGYGSQWPGMSARLLADEPVFAAALESVAALVEDQCGLDVLRAVEDGEPLQSFHDNQIGIFCVQVALASLWRSHGVEPVAVVGQSMGEVAAAVAAGGLTLRDAVRVMVARSAVLDEIDRTGAGSMVVVDAGADEVTPLLDAWPGLDVVVHASSRQCTVAGPIDLVRAFGTAMEDRGLDVWQVPGSVAPHTAAVDPFLDAFRERLASIRPRRTSVPTYATSDDDVRADVRHDVEHWVRNLRRPVRFAEAVAAAVADGHRVFVEVAPHPVAGRALRTTLADAGVDDAVVVASQRRGRDDTVTFHAALTEVRLRTLEDLPTRDERRPWVDVPRTRWRHERFWLDVARPAHAAASSSDLGTHVELPEGGRHLWTRRLGPVPDPATLLADLVHAAAAQAAAAQAVGGRAPSPTVHGYLEHQPPPTDPDAELLVSATSDGRVSVHARVGDGPWSTCASAFAAPTHPAAPAPVERPTTGAVGLREGLLLDGGPAARARLRSWLGEQVATVLGADPLTLDHTAPLVSLGLDSLTATRARNVVQAELGLTLAARLVMRGASLEEVADHLADELGLQASDGAPATPAADPDHVPAADPDPAPVVLARDPGERLVAGIWQEVLGLDRVAVDVAFHDLGGGTTEMAQVREVLARRMTDPPALEDLLGSPTVAGTAELVRTRMAGDAATPVRTLRAEGRRHPLFVFHPAGSPTSVYQPLVDLLGPDQPVFGLERIDALGTVDEKADAYLPHVRALQPRGPYRLLGWSFGGLLADAVAARLAATDEVELVAMVDTVLPDRGGDEPEHARVLERYRRFAAHVEQTYGTAIDLPLEELARMDDAQQLVVVREALAGLGDLMPAGVLEHQMTSYADTRAAERHRPDWSTLPRVLYRAEADDPVATGLDPRWRRRGPDLGWAALSAHLEVVPVPGDHVSMIDRPHVDVVARHLERVLGGAVGAR